MHPGLRYVIAFAGMVGIAVSVGILLIQATVHSWTLPVCWRCGTSRVRRSTPQPPIDSVVKFLLIVPYRCRSCRTRFYGFRTQRVVAGPNDDPVIARY